MTTEPPEPIYVFGPKGFSKAEPLFYIQATRSHVGNSVLWWCPNGEGYTTHIDKAGKYTKAQARKWTQRPTDRLWPVSHVDRHWSHHVDMQHLDYKRATLAGRKPKNAFPQLREEKRRW